MKATARRMANHRSNSIITKILSELPSDKRKILLDFLDQSTLKTEYVTLLESSSSSEEIKRLRKLNKMNKRRRKSPMSAIPKTNLSRKHRFGQAYSQEPKRFSQVNPSLRTIAAHEQQMHNFVIERKNVSDEFDSKNGEQCHTEESKEVPLDAILNKLQSYQNPFNQQRSRAQSGYSASHDEPTHPGEKEIEVNLNYDLEAGFDLDNYKTRRGKDIIILPNDLIEPNDNSAETVNMKTVRKCIKKFKYIIIAVFVLAMISLIARNIYLEVKLQSYPDQIYSMNKEINELTKYNVELESKYNE